MRNEAMADLIRALLSNVPVWSLILALLLAALQTRRAWRVDRWAETCLIWIAFWVLGIGGVYGFVAHLAFGPFNAGSILYTDLLTPLLVVLLLWLSRAERYRLR
jgi:hypothetical protein